MNRARARVWDLLAGLLLAFSVGRSFNAQTPVDPTVGMFSRGRILQIEIQMPPDVWREIRLSHRPLNDVAISPESDEAYQYRPADIRIDGTLVGRVGVRKKGFLGSVVSTRPSLKVKFDEYVPNQSFSGLNGLTLNNNNQDQALVQQFLAYDLYARAGVPASRANFARVRVNGEDLGVYTHVEAIGKPFLRRVFGNDTGVLYESYAGDFVGPRVGQIIEKSGARGQDRTKIQQLADLLAASGPLSLTRVEALVDLDSFVRMWAVESLMGHWDSYSGNRNNYYVYAHHTTGKLHFIPWGADAVFEDPGPLQTKAVPKSFKAEGLLCRRLWELPAVRERYRTTMRQLLADVWSESRLTTDMRSVQRTLQPQSMLLPETIERAATGIEGFIRQRRSQVEPELREPAPVWPTLTAAEAARDPIVLSGSFTAPWQPAPPANPMAGGMATLNVSVGGRPSPSFSRVGAYATTHRQQDDLLGKIRERYQNVTLTGLAGTTVWQVMLTIDPFLFESRPNQLAADLFEVWAIVAMKDGDAPLRMNLFGNRGELRLEQAVAGAGGQVRGSFTLQALAAP